MKILIFQKILIKKYILMEEKPQLSDVLIT